MNNIGLLVKLRRKELKLTQSDLSCTLLNRSQLSKIENNTVLPTLVQLDYLCDRLNKPFSYFLNDEKIINTNISLNSNKLIKLFNNKKYGYIIDYFTPRDFTSTYFIGMSYYKLDLKEKAIFYLSKSENLFLCLEELEKHKNVEFYCIGIITLLKLTSNITFNQECIKKLTELKFILEKFNKTNTEIYIDVINEISIFYLYRKKYKLSIDFLEKFLLKRPNTVCLSSLAHIHVNLSISYFYLKDYNHSKHNMKIAIRTFKYLQDDFKINKYTSSYIKILIYQNNLKTCRNLYNNLSLDNIYGNLKEELLLLNLTILFYEKEYKKILMDNNKINFAMLKTNQKADYNLILGKTHFILKNYTKAKKFYISCINDLKTLERYLDLYLVSYDLYVITKDENYLLLSNKYKSIYDSEDCNSYNINLITPYYLNSQYLK